MDRPRNLWQPIVTIVLGAVAAALLLPVATMLQSDWTPVAVGPTIVAALLMTVFGAALWTLYHFEVLEQTASWPVLVVAAFPMAVGSGVFRWLDLCFWSTCGGPKIVSAVFIGLALWAYGVFIGALAGRLGLRPPDGPSDDG